MATYLKRTSKLYDLSLIGSAEGEVNLGDLMCPICRGILIEPVTLPCTHNLCLRCLKGTFEHNSLTCPLCRVRVGSWLRTATKSGTLVNSTLWQLIRTRFSKEVEGKDNTDERDIQLHSGFASKKIILSAAGEIRREYEAQLQIAEEEMRRERESERLANEALIRKIREEEEREKLSQLASDRLLAKTLAKKQLLDKNKSSAKIYETQNSENFESSIIEESGEKRNLGKNLSSQPVEKHCQSFAPKLVTRNVKNQAPGKCSNLLGEPGCSGTQIFGSRIKEELQVPIDILSSKKKHLDVEVCLNQNDNDERIGSAESAGSHDSINQEIHHFKPIKPIPRTCLKISADGRPVDPKLIRVVPLMKRVSNAVPKAPSPTRIKRIPGCSWSAFRGKARKSLEDREKGNKALDENGSGRVDRNEASSTSKATSTSLKCSETSRRLDMAAPEMGVFADANKNYAKSINRILNGTKVSKKLILDETTEQTNSSRTNRAKKIQAIGSKTKKNGGGGSGSGSSSASEKRSEENSSPEVETLDCSIIENIAERIKRRKFENSTTLSSASSLAPNRKENSLKPTGKRRKMMEESEKVIDSGEQSPARLRSDKTRDKKSKELECNGSNTNENCDLEREIIEQQSRAETIISQEKKDFELAMRLQAQFDDMARIAGRTRGSKRAMALNHDNSNHFIDLEMDPLSRNTAKLPDATRTRKQRRKPQKQSVK